MCCRLGLWTNSSPHARKRVTAGPQLPERKINHIKLLVAAKHGTNRCSKDARSSRHGARGEEATGRATFFSARGVGGCVSSCPIFRACWDLILQLHPPSYRSPVGQKYKNQTMSVKNINHKITALKCSVQAVT